jgi:hypothetical protein
MQPTTTIQAIQARQNLGELLELAYYQNQQFTIARKNKPMGNCLTGIMSRAYTLLISPV